MSALSELNEQIAQCHLCEISKTRTRAVPGEGPENAGVIFIGEAPGYNEDQQGRPFVGAAGQLLDKLLASIGLTRQKVYIANVIKCRPPDNREPLPGEIQNCHRWLERQLELLQPKIIVTLGRFSMAKFLPGKTISKVHGTAQVSNGVTYFAMYHPAAALHQQSLRQEIEHDMLKLRPLIEAIDTAGRQPPPQPHQLNMFEV